jgi:hypothetical protein
MILIIIFSLLLIFFFLASRSQKNVIVIRGVSLEDPRIKDTMSKSSSPCHIILDGEAEEEGVFTHTEETCKKINPLHKSIKYSLDSVLWHVYENVKDTDFDYVWVLEDDVYVDGSLDGIIKKNSSSNKDFLASFVEDYGSNEKELNWMWWDALDESKDSSLSSDVPSLKDRVKSFFPVTRYSKRFLKEIHDRIGVYSGYCEVYIPTLAKQLGFTYGNLSKNSIGNLSLGIINPLPNNGDDRLYHKWAKR